jgi:hypothetical protein
MNLIALVDELEIRRIVDEIDNSCDLKDWDRCRSYFADEVDVDFVSLAGGEPARITVDDLIEAWRTNLFEDKKTFHQRGNHVIDIVGDTAIVFSKGYAFNAIAEGAVSGMWEVWANYTHTLVRGPGGWKVNGMKLDVIQTRGDDRVRTYVPE